ncbi:MAG TPA: MOSC domain-containing protein [Pyrinomonadaceae bacterium]|nr:MOSC domain-containing protein [Pyrinomonadaceae bacterium]
MTGQIFQLNISAGGVPKLAVREGEVNELGMVGDEHRFLDIHGGPERALCLFSLERILELQAEGHPIFPGAVGENITIAGIDWQQVVPGAQLALGEEVLLEITSYTSPCNTIPASFADGQYQRISQKAHPGWSRVYARVLRAGALRVGQKVELLNGDE